jgi:hypothetical protein
MSQTAAIALLNMVILYTNDANVPDINTPDLVDTFGFRCTPIRRLQEIATFRFGATEEQAFGASIAWVKAGRPSTTIALTECNS